MVAWLSLDQDDDDPQTFLGLVTTAIRACWADACPSALAALRLPRLPTPAFLARALADDLAQLPADMVLALDDYHCLQHPDVHALLDELLRRSIPRLHLAMTARVVPPLTLGRLRASGQLAEIDSTHLRFTPDETQAFLERSLGPALTDEMAATVQARADGWAAGLRLAAIAVRSGAAPPAARQGAVALLDRYAGDYLNEEIIARQSPEVREFLLCTALPDRFCAPLADALLDRGDAGGDSTRILAHLTGIGLFVSALDEARQWYGYHALLRDTLLHRLQTESPPGAIRAMHARASAWFEHHGQIDEAIRHALAAGEEVEAARIVERHVEVPLAHDGWPRLEAWLHSLPVACVRQRPALQLAQAWVAYFRLEIGRLPALLDRLEALLAEPPAELSASDVDALRAEGDLWWALVWIMRGEGPRAIDHARRAWEHISAAHAQALAQAGAFLGIALQMSGQPEAVPALLHSSRAEGLADPVAQLRLWAGVSYTQYAAAQFRQLESLIRQFRPLAAQFDRVPLLSWLDYWLGRVYYEWNDLESAQRQFAAVVERRDTAHFFALRASLQGLALTNLAQGKARAAVEIADSLIELELGLGSPDQADVARTFRGRLALMQGDRLQAVGWVQGVGPTEGFQLSFAVELPALTRARALIEEGGEASLLEATRSLTELMLRYEACHDTLRVIEILALQALAYRACGELEDALAALRRAVALAAPGGLLRVFVDLGAPMGSLLVELAREREYGEYVAHVLSAFDAPARPTALPGREAAALIEPLTERETEVLQLLAARWSNKEIAAHMHVSWQTVTKHCSNIYDKLQVRGRHRAVERARRLGLIYTD